MGEGASDVVWSPSGTSIKTLWPIHTPTKVPSRNQFIFAFIIIDLSESILDFICFCAFLFPFYADELLTIIQRLINKESLVKSHRRHLYQVLANEGEVAHWKISLSYGVIQLSIGLILIRIKNIGTFPVILLLATFFGIFFIINYLIKQKYSL